MCAAWRNRTIRKQERDIINGFSATNLLMLWVCSFLPSLSPSAPSPNFDSSLILISRRHISLITITTISFMARLLPTHPPSSIINRLNAPCASATPSAYVSLGIYSPLFRQIRKRTCMVNLVVVNPVVMDPNVCGRGENLDSKGGDFQTGCGAGV